MYSYFIDYCFYANIQFGAKGNFKYILFVGECSIENKTKPTV